MSVPDCETCAGADSREKTAFSVDSRKGFANAREASAAARERASARTAIESPAIQGTELRLRARDPC